MSRIEDALKKNKMEGTRQQASPRTITPGRAGGRVNDLIVAYHNPEKALTESFKQFFTQIQAQARVRNVPAETIAFTSAMKGEGKSVVALNVAVALAGDHQGPVCIVDADLRNPSLHNLLGTANSAGFSSALADVASSPASLVVPTPVERLALLPAGDKPDNPSELLNSERTAQVVRELHRVYDYVIFDCPPVLPVTDTIHLASCVDGVVLVIEAGKTNKRQVEEAVKLLGDVEMLGFILNKAHADETFKDYR